MYLMDDKKLVCVQMFEDDKPDYSHDFFESGKLRLVNSDDVLYGAEAIYAVPDVDYCVSQACSWAQYSGDFAVEAVAFDEMNIVRPVRCAIISVN